jgi:hypothetical protein
VQIGYAVDFTALKKFQKTLAKIKICAIIIITIIVTDY